MTPEEQARAAIDGMLSAAGWLIQDRTDANIDAGRGVAVREFSLGHGFGISLRRMLVGVQVALSLLLLVGASLFVRTLRNLESLGMGFPTDRLHGFCVVSGPQRV